ncbi:MAG: WG repeat-containing protein [Bacteroidota bacterium]
MKTLFSIVLCTFSFCYFAQKFYQVSYPGKYGLKDKKGKVLIKPKYDKVGRFSEGFASVQIGDKMSFINSLGKEIIPFGTYSYVGYFEKGICAVNVGGNLAEFNQVEWGAQESSGKWGFIDKTGKVVIPIKYDWVFGFKGDFAVYKLKNRWGFIDKKGEEVIPAKYDLIQSDIFDFSEDKLYMVRLNNKNSYLDRNGKEICPIIYDELFGFKKENGLSKVRIDKHFGYINKKGETIIQVKYEEISNFSQVIVAKLNNKWGIIDSLEKIIIPFEFDNLDRRSDDPILASKNNKWGCIDLKGNELIKFKYDLIRPFENGLAPVKLNEKWGFMDVNGNEIIPLIYDDTRMDYANDKKLKVTKEGKTFYINKTGEEIK